MTTNKRNPLTDLNNQVHEALKRWHNGDSTPSPLASLLVYQQARQQTDNPGQAAQQVLNHALAELNLAHAKDAKLLRLRFEDRADMAELKHEFDRGEAAIFVRQKKAIKRLTAIIDQQEKVARASYEHSLEMRLPLPPKTDTIGLATPLEKLTALLVAAMAENQPTPALIAIEGLGGLGKTTLANALIRQPDLCQYFDGLAWVSAKQEVLWPGLGLQSTQSAALDQDGLVDALLTQLDPTITLSQPPEAKLLALKAQLQRPHLIVIDNLETVVDYETLLPLLQQLARPSCFLLTSRHSLRAVPEVYAYALPGLTDADALALLRQEAQQRGLTTITQADDAALYRIVERVGGNPLALKLIVGQLTLLPFERVLAGLKAVQSQAVEQLFSYIYRQIWEALSPISQQVMLAMLTAKDNDFDYLLNISGIDVADLTTAVQHLQRLSLIEVSDHLEKPRYTIHRLTETFICTEKLPWKATPSI